MKNDPTRAAAEGVPRLTFCIFEQDRLIEIIDDLTAHRERVVALQMMAEGFLSTDRNKACALARVADDLLRLVTDCLNRLDAHVQREMP